MGVNYFFKDIDHSKYLIYMESEGKRQIYGEYGDLKSLKSALTWISKYPSYYENKKFEVKKIKVTISQEQINDKEVNIIMEIANNKGVELSMNQ